MGLHYMVKNLKEKKAKQRGENVSSRKWEQIRERAGELAMNQGKPPNESGKKEIQRAKRELLTMRVTSPRA
jgi:hypothetical protein